MKKYVDKDKLQEYTTKLAASPTIKKEYITPEMFGAVGDGITDDILAITQCFDSDVKNVVMSGKYYISSPITNVKNGTHISGGGTIQAETTGFELNAFRDGIIEDLTINYNLVGIHLTSTAGYSDYCEFRDITLNGSDPSTSVGVLIERTTHFNNEHRFTNVIAWGNNYGFQIKNSSPSVECASHRFLFCSAESSGTAGFYFQNSNFDTLLFSRIAEGNGAKIKTDGTCSRLTIVTENLVLQSEQPLSADTDGVVIGCIRSGILYMSSPGGYATITNGKIIPCAELLGRGVYEQNINSDRNAPHFENGLMSIYNAWYKYGSDPTTLTLDPNYYGGEGKINDIYVYVASWAGDVTVTDGTVTKTLPKDTANAHHYHLSYFYINNARVWRVEEYNLSF